MRCVPVCAGATLDTWRAAVLALLLVDVSCHIAEHCIWMGVQLEEQERHVPAPDPIGFSLSVPGHRIAPTQLNHDNSIHSAEACSSIQDLLSAELVSDQFAFSCRPLLLLFPGPSPSPSPCRMPSLSHRSIGWQLDQLRGMLDTAGSFEGSGRRT